MTETAPLADGFRPIDREAWRALVAKTLTRSRGGAERSEVERVLATPTDDGYAVQALYTADDVADAAPPALPGTGNFVRGASPAGAHGWSIRQRHWLGGPIDSSARIAEDLAAGVDSLWLTVVDPDVLPAVLAGIDLTATPVVLEAFRRGAPAADALLEVVAGLPAVAAGTSLGLDPVGLLAGTGRLGDFDTAMEFGHVAHSHGIGAFAIDGTIYHDAGASFAEEIGCAVAAAVTTLRGLIDADMAPADAAGLFEFRFAVTDDQFASIAKLRAARVVWARVLEVAGIELDHGMNQHAVTSAAMLTARDPWVNLIRNCVAAFSGGVGGANAVTVLPHSLAAGVVDELSERMARNTQHLILEESHAGFVTDPGGGSYSIEARTRQLADASWSWLQEIEGAGGMRRAVDSELVAHRIERTWTLRRERTAKRSSPITGVTDFADRERLPAAQPEPWTRPGGALPQHRYSESFEALRNRADAAPVQPTVVLLTVGSLARYGAREAFAANLFAAGGIATVSVAFQEGEPVRLPEGVRVVCLCGADKDYASAVPSAAAAARAAGAGRIWLAGRAGARAHADAAAGVDAHLFAGCNVLAVLEQTLSDIGVPE
jgi:methylmalonyl-CoA mutase